MIRFKEADNKFKRMFLKQTGYDENKVEDVKFYEYEEIVYLYEKYLKNFGLDEWIPFFKMDSFIENSVKTGETGVFKFDGVKYFYFV